MGRKSKTQPLWTWERTFIVGRENRTRHVRVEARLIEHPTRGLRIVVSAPAAVGGGLIRIGFRSVCGGELSLAETRRARETILGIGSDYEPEHAVEFIQGMRAWVETLVVEAKAIETGLDRARRAD